MSYGIHWFRRDLRTAGNPALEWSLKRHHGRVVGIFAFDPKFLARPDIGTRRFAFLIETLAVLQQELRSLGGDLLVLDQGPDHAFRELFEALQAAKRPVPSSVSWNRDYEPFARERDARVEALLSSELGVETHSESDHLLIEPKEIFKDKPDSWYQVYTPFQKKWLSQLTSIEVQKRITQQAQGLKGKAGLFGLTWQEILPGSLRSHFEDRLETYRKKVRSDVPLPPAGSQAAFKLLKHFKDDGLEHYAECRDFPGVSGTSKLSIYLKNGSITVAQIISALDLQNPRKLRQGSSPQKYLSELIWREFYYHILYHCPRVEHEAFQVRYKNIAWENDEKLFKAWCEGKTGYPIVDAAMRQLNETGWMHNRLRMIVASFLTKDLLVNWQWGERYFMEKLLDGDLAPNNGGWQWAASTGCDPQPYFRIFNPTLQGKRYDENGDFVRRFVPELASIEKRFIHEPQKYVTKSAKISAKYPEPIVDHARQSRKAIALFKNASKVNE